MGNERLHSGGDYLADVAKEAAERSKELARSPERHSTSESAERATNARREALEAAKEAQEHASAETESQTFDEFEPPASRKKREQAFTHTMTHIQKEMPRSSRAFSKVIHNPVIEKTSNIVANTIARPNSVISGSL
ncbi:MAG TPA: hypothetical protein VFT87_04330, partial [Candidatus Saccharimonadales bacterium]|nr:hypothetical protein [Candidatus Saccharimonadales bacterium]